MKKVKDITNIIEKVQNNEDKTGIVIDRLFCAIDDRPFDEEQIITITGEIRKKDCSKLGSGIEIIADAFDERGRIIGKDTDFILKSENLSVFKYFTI